MLVDGLQLTDTGKALNLVIDNGTSFPSGNEGELFVLTAQYLNYAPGLYFYSAANQNWLSTGSGAGKAYQGVYASGTTYGLNDIVTDGNGFYISLVSSNIGNALADTASWAEIGVSSPSLGSIVITESMLPPSVLKTLQYMGSHDSAVTYGLNEIVTDGTYYYISLIVDNTHALTDTAHWAQLGLVAPAHGFAALDSSSKISESNLPSSVFASLQYQGIYASGTTYGLNDIVTDGTGFYISVVSSNIGHSLTDGSKWAAIGLAEPAYGFAQLDSGSKISESNLPSSVLKAIQYKGAYISNVAYGLNEIVTDGTYYYISLVDANAGNALTDTSRWIQLGIIAPAYGFAPLDSTSKIAESLLPASVLKSVLYKGNYASNVTYDLNQIVTDGTYYYISTVASNKGNDLTDTARWIQFGLVAPAHGYAPLNVNSKLDTAYLPDSILGSMQYKGVWNATTDSPALPSAVTSNKGFYYVVNVEGTTNIDGTSSWSVGDWVVSNGTTWDKVSNTNAVVSVAGKTGAVALTKSDVGLANVNNTADMDKPVSNATQTALALKLDASKVGVANGVCPLGSDDKIAAQYLPDSLSTGLKYQGGWDASANSPAIPSATSGNKGNYYVVSTAGSTNISGHTTWHVGDWVVSNGVTWDQVSNTSAVTSVAGKTGAVALVKADVGLANVDNTSDVNKPISTDTQAALDLKANLNSPTFTGTVGGISKAMVGLGNVSNTSDANKPISNATQTALDAKAPINNPTFTGTVAGVTKAMVGLSNVDNTSDVNKPISNATQTALDAKAPLASPTFTGTVSGISKAMVGLSNVDNTSDANKPISNATQTALDALSASITSGVGGVTKTSIGLGNVDNTSDVNKPVSTATQTALDAKAPLASPTFTGTVSGISKAMVGLANVDNTSDANKPISSATQTALNTLTTAVNGKIGLSSVPYDLAGSIIGLPQGGAVIVRFIANRAFTIASALAGSIASCATPSTATQTLTLKKNGSAFGTITFSASVTSGQLAAASATSFASGDVLTIENQATADLTFADCEFTIAASLS